MSIIDLILEQKIILITAALAGVVLFAAIGLLVVSRLKKSAAKRARRQALRQAARAAQEAEEAAVSEEDMGAFQRPVQPQSAEAKGKQAAVAPIATPQAAPTAKTMPAQPAAPVPAAQTTAAASTPSQGQETPKAMQDILSSVFGDEESLARYAVLLSGFERVDAADLLALCNDIAARVNTKFAPARE